MRFQLHCRKLLSPGSFTLCVVLAACGGGGSSTDEFAAGVAASPPAVDHLQRLAAESSPSIAPDLATEQLSPASVLEMAPEAPSGDATPSPGTELQSAPASSMLAVDDQIAGQTALRSIAGTAPLVTAPAASGPAGDAASATSQLGFAASMTKLSFVAPAPVATTLGVGSVVGCMRGYSPPASLTRTTPATSPANGGVFYTPAEQLAWRQRVASGSFVTDGDFTKGSPGDWSRVVANANAFAASGELEPSTGNPPDFTKHGTLARDAAFHHLITAEGTRLAALRGYLLAQARNPALDFPTTLCITNLSGGTTDAWFHQAGWLLRYVVTYDFVRSVLASNDRVKIENFIRRNAYFLAANSDWGLSLVFPARQSGNYSQRARDAAPATAAATWWSKRFDTNGDCKVDARDATTAYSTYAYTMSNGALGPRISGLSQWYNNRRSAATAAYGAAGVLLGDANLIASAKRYFMEWLTYSVWPDGSQGEYARNGDYCIAPQGLIYGASNEQGAGLLARLLARQGDRTLIDFATTDGLFGSQSPNVTNPKTLELVVSTRLKLLRGQLAWYYHEPWRAAQNISASGSIGNPEVRYMGGARAIDNYHELGLLPLAGLLPKLPIGTFVLRDRAVTSLRFPGSTGNPVATGSGIWTDAFNALPAVLLLRP
ncbi:MAG: hypothetical protein JNK55_15210 [Rubrivivax sp.]|nr:hypothetical protein [Rubrivivax sp.]